MAPDERGCTPGPHGNCGAPAPAPKPSPQPDPEAAARLSEELGESVLGHGRTSAHDTAIALRVLDLQREFQGRAWITTNLGNSPGADLICWNCAAEKSGGKVQEVWVWEIKAAAQSPSTAAKSMRLGIEWAEKHVLRGRSGGQPKPVVPGRPFPLPSTGVNNQKVNQVVTVFSDPQATESTPTGVEYYQTYDYKKKVPQGHEYRQKTADAFDAVADAEEEERGHIEKAQDTGVKEDPVSSWGIAGGIGIGVAFGGFLLLGTGGTVVVVAGLCQADYALAG
jgi:hypothetical protein